MAESTAAKAAARSAKDVIVDQIKDNGKLSLTLGVGVTVLSFGVLTTLLAANAVYGAGQGVVEGIKSARRS